MKLLDDIQRRYDTSTRLYVCQFVEKLSVTRLCLPVSELMSFDTFFHEGVSIPEIQHWTRYV